MHYLISPHPCKLGYRFLPWNPEAEVSGNSDRDQTPRHAVCREPVSQARTKFFGLAQKFWWRTHIFSCFAAETNLCTTFFGQMFAQSITNLCKPDNFYSKCINKETIFIFLQQILFYCDLHYFVAILSWFTRFLRKILVCQIWIAQFF